MFLPSAICHYLISVAVREAVCVRERERDAEKEVVTEMLADGEPMITA